MCYNQCSLLIDSKCEIYIPVSITTNYISEARTFVDETVPEFKADIIPTWSNSLGMDAVLHENDYLRPT
ncbi:MAG: hypothetical protein QNJ54_18370 [Prochloraceae cyanobacterium]|nr:hypothetical protein [Prochloraceae cyanobacterium]